jgi:hypothetical protein
LGNLGVDYIIEDLMCFIPDMKKLYLSNIINDKGKNGISVEGAVYLSLAKWEKL